MDEITPREILFSIVIFCIMMIIGFRISEAIKRSDAAENRKYYSAQRITDSEQFEYGMKTNVGNAFVYGPLEAVDTVTYPEIGGAYTYISKSEVRHRRHETTETEKDKDGNEHTVTVVSYSWDTVSTESLQSKEIKFMNHIFSYKKIPYYNSKYIDTIYDGFVYDFYSGERVRVRYEYSGTQISEVIGTIYTELKDNTISDSSTFYNNSDIDQTLKIVTSHIGLFVFWFFWIIITFALIYGFYMLPNDWLE